MSRKVTDYEVFESSSTRNRRLLRQEELILDITEALSKALEEEGVTKTELAKRLGKTKGFVSQILAGGRNLTLRTIADVADALGRSVHIQCEKPQQVEQVEREAKVVRLVAWSDQPMILKEMPGKKIQVPVTTPASLLETAA